MTAFRQTGEMGAGDGHIVFGAEGARVLILTDGGDIVLDSRDQDLFARHLFRAMGAASVILDAAQVPF